MNLKHRILQANDRPLVAVHVPEWDCTVFVRPWSKGQLDEFIKDEKDTSRLLAFSLCDENGVAIFTPEEATLLDDKNVKVLTFLVDEVLKANGVHRDSLDAAKKN